MSGSMSPTALETMIVIGLLLFASAFFAGSETALFSLSRLVRETLASRTDRGSRRVLTLLQNPRRLIVTLIVCNELVNVSASSMAATLVSRLLPRVPELGRVMVASGIMIPLILFVGEMAPKSIAIRLGERWAKIIAAPLQICAYVIAPIRLLLSFIAGAVVLALGQRQQAPQGGLREEEFRALVDVGSEEGELETTERRLIHNVFEFGDTTVAKVMTRGEKVFALPYEMPLGRLALAVAQQSFSRVPIYRSSGQGASARRAREGASTAGKLDVVGILLAKDLVGYQYGHLEGHTIQELLHPPLFVPRNTKCDRLFREFQRRKTHVALVVDEYGHLAGLVTMEDLLEELFGELGETHGKGPTP